ncbi:MAG: hypothetical protein KAF91_31555 [Nostoc sp. TH1S01]|nr:hypothetical protein [Nostoc sp. TH1S01]
MQEETLKTILIITDETSQVTDFEDGKAAGSGNPWKRTPRENKVVQDVPVSAEKLEANLSEFLKLISGIFKRADEEAEKTSGMQLDEIELSIEITGKGEVKLVGTGVAIESKGAIKLKFKRDNLQI